MKNSFLAICILWCLLAVGQDNNKYATSMKTAFQLWEEEKLDEASNMFERIAITEEDNWLPYYYAAQVNTMSSFGIKEEEMLSQKLEKAKQFLSLAKQVSPNNAEILVMEAMMNTAWVSFDGANYGMKLSPIIVQLHVKAEQLDPDNPRVILSKAEWDMGSARFFGQDIAPYCKDIERASKLFSTYKSKELFYPSWGEGRARQILEKCKK